MHSVHSLLKLAQLRLTKKKGKRKVQGVPQSQTAALPRHQEEEETDKSKQAQIEKKYEAMLPECLMNVCQNNPL